MDRHYKRILPGEIQRIVDEIEAAIGGEIEVRHDQELKRSSSTVFKEGEFHACARTFEEVVGEGKLRIGFSFAYAPLAVPIAVHELLHFKARFLDHGWRIGYEDPSLGLPRHHEAEAGFGYDLSLILEHIEIYNQMRALGISLEAERHFLGCVLANIDGYPAGLKRRIVAVMLWLTVCCGPFLGFKTGAAQMLLEQGMSGVALKLESQIKPYVGRPQSCLGRIYLCATALGIPLESIAVQQMVLAGSGQWGVDNCKLSDFSLI
jgi:hypothetical protein